MCAPYRAATPPPRFVRRCAPRLFVVSQSAAAGRTVRSRCESTSSIYAHTGRSRDNPVYMKNKNKKSRFFLTVDKRQRNYLSPLRFFLRTLAFSPCVCSRRVPSELVYFLFFSLRVTRWYTVTCRYNTLLGVVEIKFFICIYDRRRWRMMMGSGQTVATMRW